MRLAKVVSLGMVALLAVACGGIVIPSIPPIPSFPGIPSGLFPSGLPTPEPGSFDPNGMCRLMSAAEVGTIMGATETITQGTGTSCTYTASQTFASINVRTESGDLTAATVLLGSTAKDLTINGLPAKSGVFIGSPLVYVQRGGDHLVLQGVLVGNDDATIAKVVQLATLAASRW